MYRLLIVDDEEIIVNGLYEIFRGIGNLDLDVYKAYSGEEAMEWLNRTRIDIMLTDICMPGTDGIRLLEEIRRYWPQCRVIFLTGHSEFEYAYRAIQHPGVSYILKTEDHEKVIGTVAATIEDIKKEIKTGDLIHTAKEQMNMALELFQKDYFLHLLKGDSDVAAQQAQFEGLSVSLYAKFPILLALGSVNTYPNNLAYFDKIQHLLSLKQIIGRYLATHVNSLIVMDENYRFILFIQPKEPATGESYTRSASFLKGTLEAIQTACQNTLGAPISFAMSEEACMWEFVSAKYYSLSQLLNYRIGTRGEVLLAEGEFQNSIRNDDSAVITPEITAESEPILTLLQKDSGAKLERYLESGQKEEYFEVLRVLTDLFRTIRSKNNNAAIELYYSISLPLLSYINRWRLTEKLAFFSGQNKLMRMDLFSVWGEAADYLWELSNILFDVQTKGQKKRADNTILYLRKFIEEHLGEDLSLVRLAELVYLNPSYLSRLYKQETGSNLSDFIESTRIHKAKEMLKNNLYKVNEIARLVGYETAASFTRFFKKAAGISPQEYRDSHLLRRNM